MPPFVSTESEHLLEAVEVDAALVVVPVLVVDWILVEEEEVVPATVVVVDVGVTTVDPPHACETKRPSALLVARSVEGITKGARW